MLTVYYYQFFTVLSLTSFKCFHIMYGLFKYAKAFKITAEPLQFFLHLVIIWPRIFKSSHTRNLLFISIHNTQTTVKQPCPQHTGILCSKSCMECLQWINTQCRASRRQLLGLVSHLTAFVWQWRATCNAQVDILCAKPLRRDAF